jgi:hypothetical protein
MEFLYSSNRLNVATSRAQCVTVLVTNPALFERSRALGASEQNTARVVPRILVTLLSRNSMKIDAK